LVFCASYLLYYISKKNFHTPEHLHLLTLFNGTAPYSQYSPTHARAKTKNTIEHSIVFISTPFQRKTRKGVALPSSKEVLGVREQPISSVLELTKLRNNHTI
jgi:hypothetical protein